MMRKTMTNRFNDEERAELKEIMLEALKEYHNPSSPYRLDELQE